MAHIFIPINDLTALGIARALSKAGFALEGDGSDNPEQFLEVLKQKEHARIGFKSGVYLVWRRKRFMIELVI